jgi:hypothetical protein
MSTLSFNSYQEVLLPGLYPWKAWASIHGPASRLLISYQVQVSYGDTSIWTNYDQPAVCIWYARLSKVPVASWVILVAIQQREPETQQKTFSLPLRNRRLNSVPCCGFLIALKFKPESICQCLPVYPDFRTFASSEKLHGSA